MTELDSRLELVASLPILQRLSLTYAPAAALDPQLAFFALDTRLAGIVRNSREPMLAQLRLSWWREQIAANPATWPRGDRLLGVLATWPGERTVLVGLVDGWEAMTGDSPLPASSIECLAEARGKALAMLADDTTSAANALKLGRNWALADIASHLSRPEERQVALDLARSQDWRWARLPRNLRPLAVLHGIAGRNLAKGLSAGSASPLMMLTAIRLGLFGR